ncbi:Signal transduction histidine kinase [Amphibacillus marinus]|uniref:histidine kinase n=1 Tax=Amphibacillus marinus TaxID=872970 RepID=A0A1H8KKV9_9BACI|nr:HAMP domain-containing sensor histidine kinase [Amphibacillus marinus]SEN93620.1 Signal transduction histidine kinase [Amphibacillus marinus]
MRIKFLAATILTIFTLGMVLSVIVIQRHNIQEVDVVAINDLTKKIENNWGQVTAQHVDHIVSQPFSIIDREENVLYRSPASSFTSSFASIKNRDTLIDLQQNNEVVGKLIIQNDAQSIVVRMKRDLIIAVTLILGLLMVVILIYLAIINRTLVKPFQQLQHFAVNVARGDFDRPLTMGKNNYFGAFTESFDLLRDELATARQRAYESNRSKKELVATLSHDIKTPLASIKAVTELMLLQTNDNKVKKHVQTIFSKADQIDLLVTDMFHATLEELQQLKVAVVEVSSTVLREMIENVNFDHNIDYDPIPPCLILTDTTRLQQVLDNIISNAYKYARTKIKIESRIHQDYLEVDIIDFGRGISEAELPLLFNKYYRGQNIAGQNGSGLGLYISKYFIEKMHGQINCYNRTDGFTVAIKIKLAT